MITEGDLLRRVETSTQRRRPRWMEFFVGPGRLAQEYTHSHGRKVSDVMTIDPVCVTEEAPLEEVVKIMEKRRIKRLPVVRGEKVVGMISRANLVHALARLSTEAKPSQTTDLTIKEQLLGELQKHSWAPVSALDIIARDGVVDLWGTITDERARQALIVAAENVPGVKGVQDHLVWIDPMSVMAFVPPEETSQQVADTFGPPTTETSDQLDDAAEMAGTGGDELPEEAEVRRKKAQSQFYSLE